MLVLYLRQIRLGLNEIIWDISGIGYLGGFGSLSTATVSLLSLTAGVAGACALLLSLAQIRNTMLQQQTNKTSGHLKQLPITYKQYLLIVVIKYYILIIIT